MTELEKIRAAFVAKVGSEPESAPITWQGFKEGWQAAGDTPADTKGRLIAALIDANEKAARAEMPHINVYECIDIIRQFDCATPADHSVPVAWITKEQLSQLTDLTADAWVYWRESGHAAEDDEIALYAASQRSEIEQYVLSVLPSVYYMDPPDGGDVSLLEQLRRMADDASKYRASINAADHIGDADKKVEAQSVPVDLSEPVLTDEECEQIANIINMNRKSLPPRKYDPATQWGSPEFDGAEAYQAHLEAMYPDEVTPLDHHSDDRAVDEFARLMKQKMAASRAKGRGGWDDPNVCSVKSLSAMLHEHVAKGDPVDVANFCMMLRHYDAKIAPDDHSVRDLTKLSYELSNALLDLENGCFDDTSMRKITLVRDELIAASQAQPSDAQSVRDAWISVDERLPEGGELVLVCVRNGVQSSDEDAEEYECEAVQVVDFGQFNEPGGYMECFAGPHGAFADDITHWQSLPAPPQKPVSDEVKP